MGHYTNLCTFTFPGFYWFFSTTTATFRLLLHYCLLILFTVLQVVIDVTGSGNPNWLLPSQMVPLNRSPTQLVASTNHRRHVTPFGTRAECPRARRRGHVVQGSPSWSSARRRGHVVVGRRNRPLSSMRYDDNVMVMIFTL